MRWTAFLALAGCAPTWEDMLPRQVCDDVGSSISARTLECTGDVELAQARYDAFQRGYDCLVESVDEPIDRYYHCPIAVNALDCDEVEAAGDDLGLWLEASWVCGEILAEAGAP